MNNRLLALCAAALLSLGDATPAAALGEVSDPFVAFDSAWVFEGDTRIAAASLIDAYACDPSKPEQGPELVFRVELAEESDLDVSVETDGTGVDIDVHLLASLSLVERRADDCIARADKTFTAFRAAPGRYFVVADTYGSSAAKAGKFRLTVRAYPTARATYREIGSGVRWGRQSVETSAGFVTINSLDVDPSAGARLAVGDPGGLKAMDRISYAPDVVAAVNAGLFDGTTPLGVMRVDGTTVQPSRGVEHVVAIAANGAAQIRKPAAGDQMTEVPNAVAGRGAFLLDGPTPRWDTDASQTSFHQSRHPRTVLSLGPGGAQRLWTADGRTDAGAGLSFAGIAAVAAAHGATHALNFDGGGSTTMWVRGEPNGGIVNYPSDNGNADHLGTRSVRSLVLVRAPPLPDAPLITSLGGAARLRDGAELVYSATARANGDVRWRLVPALDNAEISEGTLRFRPDYFQWGRLSLQLEACMAACAMQTLVIESEWTDADADALPDAWERAFGLDPSRDDAALDPDGDGASNAEEYLARSHPLRDERPAPPPPAPSGGEEVPPEAPPPQEAERPLDTPAPAEDVGRSGCQCAGAGGQAEAAVWALLVAAVSGVRRRVRAGRCAR